MRNLHYGQGRRVRLACAVARLQDGLREQGQYAIRSSFLQVLQFDDVARVSLLTTRSGRSGPAPAAVIDLPAMRAETRPRLATAESWRWCEADEGVGKPSFCGRGYNMAMLYIMQVRKWSIVTLKLNVADDESIG